MRAKGIVCTSLLAFAWLALFCGLLLFSGRVSRAYDGISLRISDTLPSEKKLKKLMEQEEGDLALTAAWHRGETAAVAAKDGTAAAKARPVAVYGDIRQVCPMRLLSGSYLPEGDTAGCLLTSDVAMALFHSVDAEDAIVRLHGKTYTVRGILSAYEPMVITRGGADAAYENLEFALADPSGGAARVDAFVYRHELSGAYVVVQSGMYGCILSGLTRLPAALACVLAAWPFWTGYLRRRKNAASLWRLLPSIGLPALALLLLWRTFYWPQAYLPTKCSDFAFWRGLLISLRTAWKAISLTTPLPKDIQFFQAARVMLFGTLLTLLLENRLYRRILYLTRLRCEAGLEETRATSR